MVFSQKHLNNTKQIQLMVAFLLLLVRTPAREGETERVEEKGEAFKQETG